MGAGRIEGGQLKKKKKKEGGQFKVTLHLPLIPARTV